MREELDGELDEDLEADPEDLVEGLDDLVDEPEDDLDEVPDDLEYEPEELLEPYEDFVEGLDDLVEELGEAEELRLVVLVVPLGDTVLMRVLDEPEDRTLLLTVVCVPAEVPEVLPALVELPAADLVALPEVVAVLPDLVVVLAVPVDPVDPVAPP